MHRFVILLDSSHSISIPATRVVHANLPTNSNIVYMLCNLYVDFTALYVIQDQRVHTPQFSHMFTKSVTVYVSLFFLSTKCILGKNRIPC
jgi:hypothetical protein